MYLYICIIMYQDMTYIIHVCVIICTRTMYMYMYVKGCP